MNLNQIKALAASPEARLIFADDKNTYYVIEANAHGSSAKAAAQVSSDDLLNILRGSGAPGRIGHEFIGDALRLDFGDPNTAQIGDVNIASTVGSAAGRWVKQDEVIGGKPSYKKLPIPSSGLSALYYDEATTRWILQYDGLSLYTVSTAASPSLITTPWLTSPNNAPAVLTVALTPPEVLQAQYIGQWCRVGTVEPFLWYRWSGEMWEEGSSAESTASILAKLGGGDSNKINPDYVYTFTQSPTPPVSAIARSLPWLDTTDGSLSVWDAAVGAWVALSSGGAQREVPEPEKGDPGAVIISGSFTPSGDLVFVKDDDSTVTIPGAADVLRGPIGPTGPQGVSLNLRGSVATVGNLPTSPTFNDAYIVTATGHLHFWNGTLWVDAGTIVGPAGPTGPQGPPGPVVRSVRNVYCSDGVAVNISHAQDLNGYVRLTTYGSATPIAALLGIPAYNATTAPWVVGDNVTVRIASGDIGSLTLVPAAGVVLNGASNVASMQVEDTFVLMYVAADTWDVI